MSSVARSTVSIFVALAIGLLAAWQIANAQGEAKKERPTWEYTALEDGAGARELGDVGWELVAVSSRGVTDKLYFKRQK